MEFALPTAVAALAMILVSWRLRARRRAKEVGGTGKHPPRLITVALDVGDADPGSPSVRRLVGEAASRAALLWPEVTEIDVVSRSGALLGRVRPGPRSPRSGDPPPRSLVEPHVVRRPTGSSSGMEAAIHPAFVPRFEARERPARKRTVAESFDLPEAVLKRIRQPDDVADVVRAILEAAGLGVEVADDVIRSDDRAIVVVPSGHRATYPDALSHAYLRFRKSGAGSGVVLSLGSMDASNVRRRELLAPELRHAGPEAIQRMADAIAVGADPLAFVLGPAVIEGARDQRAG